MAGPAALAQLSAGPASATPRRAGHDYPYTLGVASGDPTPTGVVLWTRLAPKPFEDGGGMPDQRVQVEWQIARDERFSHPAKTLTFAFASCQDWSSGYYSAYRHMADEDLDLVIHLGDYVYEGGITADGGYRQVPTPNSLRDAPRDLERWRMQYALFKSDPVRRPAMPDADGPKVYRRAMWGGLAQINIVDGRQYRSIPPCGWGEADACAAGYDPAITMLGAEQERWLYDGLRASSARWNVLANNVMLSRLDHDGDAGDRLLARRLGRLPGCAQPAHRRLGRSRDPQRGRRHRRLALDLRHRRQARVRRPGLGGDRDRVRQHVDLVQR